MVHDELCKILLGLQAPTPVRVQVAGPGSQAALGAQPAQPAAGGTSIEERLRKLDELHKKGLVSDAEYQEKRAELLSQL
jgi:hypothetical protein